MIVDNRTDEQLAAIEHQILRDVPQLKFHDLEIDRIFKHLDTNAFMEAICNRNYESSTDFVTPQLLYNGSYLQSNYGRDVQCQPGKNRSQGDLYQLAKYYRPDLTFRQFIEAMWTLVNNNKYGTFICPNIGKRVWFTPVNKYDWFIRDHPNMLTDPDEYGHKLPNHDYNRYCHS